MSVPHQAPPKLKLVDAIAQSVGFLGPVFSGSIVLILLIAGASGKSAGAAAPLSVLIAVVGVLALGWIVAQYAKRIHAAGSLYNYVSAGFGIRIGAAAGLLYYFGIIFLGGAIAVYIGGYIHDTLLTEFGGAGLPIWAWQILMLVLLLGLVHIGVRISIKTQLALALVSMIVLVIFFTVVIVRVGSDNSTIAFTPGASPDGWGGVLFGVLYGVLLFTGFEAAANLAEETENPKRNIPRAILISVAIAAGFFILATYAQVAGFHFALDKITAAISSGQSPLVFLGGPPSEGGYGSVAVRRLLELVILLDMIAVYIGVSVSATRGVFALARDRWLPQKFDTISAKRGTPIMGTALVGVVYLALITFSHIGAAPFRLPGTPDYFSLFQWFSTCGILSLVVVYLLMSLGAVRGLAGHERPILVWVASIVGAILAVGAIFGSIYKVPAPTVWTTYVVFAVFGVTMVVAAVLGRGRTAADMHGVEDSESGRAPALVVE